MIRNKIIIIGEEHHNTLGVLRSIGEIGIQSHLIITQSPKPFVIHSKYIDTLYRIENESQLSTTLLSHFGNEEFKPIVICCDDKSIATIDNNYNKLSNLFILPNAGKVQSNINRLMSKAEQQRFANQVGLSIPKTWTIYGNNSIPSDIIYPCIVKTNTSISGSKTDIKVCYSADELLANTRREVEYLIQEYIEKEFELNVVACAYNNGQNLIIPGVIHKIREYPAKKGSSSFSVLRDCSQYPYLPVDKIKKMMSLIEYDGLFSIEFICKDNKCYFLEINFRNDGNGYIPTSAGVNLPYLWCCSRLSLPIPHYEPQTPHYFMADVRDIFHVVKDKSLSFKQWRNDFKRTNCFLLYNRKDKMPFIVYIWHWFVEVLRLFPSKICKLVKDYM